MLPTIFPRIQHANPTLARKLESQGFFVTDADIDGLVAISRHALVLVRTGNGRFLCPVDTVRHFVKVIDGTDPANGGDYVRDVSLPVNVHVTG